MVRVKRGLMTWKRHKNIIAQAKGFRMGRKNVFSYAKNAVMKAGTNAYKDRRRKKRDFRRLWIVRINIATREHEMSYNDFVRNMYVKQVKIDRKNLSNLTISHPEVFKKIVEFVK